MANWRRVAMAVVGLAVLFTYTAAAFLAFLLLRWGVANPPDPLVLVGGLVLGIVLGGFLGYRLGSIRLLTSLDGRRLPRERAPELHTRLDRLAEHMHVRRPPILVAHLGAPNALSIGGPRQGVIVLDRQLLALLSVDELEGILAHELAHLESHHTFVNTLALTAVRTLVGVVMLALAPLVLLLAGLDRAAAWFAGRPHRRFGLATLFNATVTILLGVVLSLVTLGFLAYSRKQEFAADSRAADVTGNPAALARALEKIHRANQPRSGLLSLLYIHDDRRRAEHPLLSTHPPLGERIDRLLARAGPAAQRQTVRGVRPP